MWLQYNFFKRSRDRKATKISNSGGGALVNFLSALLADARACSNRTQSSFCSKRQLLNTRVPPEVETVTNSSFLKYNESGEAPAGSVGRVY